MEKQQVLINGERLKQMVEQFADYGRTENNGVTRLALSEVDLQVRNHFKDFCENLGLTVKWDDVGNMYARLNGIENDKPPLVIGSHLDSVKKGGRFDGVLGVLTGLEVVQTLMENDIQPQVPIVVANFTNEEGARFEPSMMASGVISGKFDKGKMLASTDEHGMTFGEALKNSGFEGEKENRLDEATGLIELHIEQGPVLEKEKFEIGVVECVVGMCCYEIEVTGDSNHAGTTPMTMREDALFATNSLINEIRERMSKLDSELVYTIGRVNVSPNIHTVIPNKVVFSIESRHKEARVIKEVEEIIQGLSHSESKEVCEVKTTKLWDRYTVWFNDQLIESVEKSCKALNYSYKRMPSGAGHDAQFIATYLPAAMVFVPSVNGKSHAEDELTYWEDCEKGVNVVLQTVLDLVGS